MSTRLACMQSEGEQMNWNEEAKLHLQHLNNPLPCIENSPLPAQQGSRVLLTGATGFLGRHILRLLIEDPTVHTIHYVAIREHRIPSDGAVFGISSPKIQIWPGDLSKPYLGLMGSTFTRLAESIDLIIHSGADVSFLKTYSSLLAPNVRSNVELGRMALFRGIPLHYISSAGVKRLASSSGCCTSGSEDSDLSGYCSGSEDSLENPTDIMIPFLPTNGSDGYIASKWASEQIMERGRLFGLRAHIHRSTTLVSEGVPSTDLLQNVLRYSRLLKPVSRFDSLDGVVNMIPAEDAARNVLLSTREREPKQTIWYSGVQVHIYGLGKYAPESAELLKTPEMNEWVYEATNLGLSSQVASILPRRRVGEATS